jgi:hypothetical protein
MDSQRASVTRRHPTVRRCSLFVPLVILGLIVVFSLPGSDLQAESRFIMGTPQANEALGFDPYNLSNVEPTIPEAAEAADAAEPVDPEAPVAPDEEEDIPFPGLQGPGGSGSSFLLQQESLEWRIWVLARPLPASPINLL